MLRSVFQTRGSCLVSSSPFIQNCTITECGSARQIEIIHGDEENIDERSNHGTAVGSQFNNHEELAAPARDQLRPHICCALCYFQDQLTTGMPAAPGQENGIESGKEEALKESSSETVAISFSTSSSVTLPVSCAGNLPTTQIKRDLAQLEAEMMRFVIACPVFFLLTREIDC